MEAKRQKIRDAELEELEVDDFNVIARNEQKFINQPVVEDLHNTIDDLFRAAVDRPSRRVQPPKERFSDPNALKDYQQQGLGWLLDREGYVSIDEEIYHRWVQNPVSRPPEWTNTETGVTVTSEPVKGFTGRKRPQLGVEKVENSVYGGILADEMGLGKTVQMVSLISAHEASPKHLRNVNNSSKATLVVVPPILLGTWESELKKWAPQLSRYIHYGPERTKRRKSLRLKKDVVLTTYQTFLRDEDMLNSIRWWRIILDEGHMIKNADTDLARAMHSVNARNRWIMSGTPIQNTWRDLYSLLKFLHVRPYGEFQGWYRLIEQPITAITTPAGRYKAQATENLRNLIRVLVMRRTKKTQAGQSVETGSDPLLKPGLVIQLSPWTLQNRILSKNRGVKFWKVKKTRLFDYDVENVESGDRPILETRLPYIGGDSKKTYEFVKELVHIPEKHKKIIILKFKDWERKFYEKLEKKGVGIIKQWVEGRAVEAGPNNPLVFLLRLRQAAIHPWLTLPKEEWKRKIYRRENETLDQYRERLEKDWRESAKLEYISKDLRETLNGGKREKEKSLVFSQFTRALDLLEIQLRLNGWIPEKWYQQKPKKYADRPRYVRIDGTSTRNEREWAMHQLKNEPNVKLALLSLHATGVGLNLISANNVYFMDLFFNPQVHAQAIDRTHRIGQDKKVVVKNVIVDGTIEDKLRKLHDYKQQIFEFTLKPFVISKDRIFNLLYRDQ